MADVTFAIAGFTYRLGCAAGDEPRLKALAAIVDEQARAARALDPGATEARTLLMAALMLADALAEQAPQGSAPDADATRAALEALAERVEALADRHG